MNQYCNVAFAVRSWHSKEIASAELGHKGIRWFSFLFLFRDVLQMVLQMVWGFTEELARCAASDKASCTCCLPDTGHHASATNTCKRQTAVVDPKTVLKLRIFDVICQAQTPGNSQAQMRHTATNCNSGKHALPVQRAATTINLPSTHALPQPL